MPESVLEREEFVCSAVADPSRTAVEKHWLFHYEWHHPGEQEANAQKPKLLGGTCVTGYIGQNHKTLGLRGFGVVLGAGWSDPR